MKLGLKIFTIVTASIAGLSILIFSLALIILPKLKIIDTVVEQVLPHYIDGKVSYEKLSLSLFRYFPRIGLSLDGFKIEGIDEFDGVELCHIDRFVAECNIAHLLRKKLELLIELNNGSGNVLVLESGKANYNIFKGGDVNSEDKKSKESNGNDINFQGQIFIRGIKVENLNLSYTDKALNTEAQINGLDFFIGGNFSLFSTALKLQAAIAEANLKVGMIPIVSKLPLKLETLINADFNALKFELENAKLSVNQIEGLLNGFVAFPKNDGIDMDLKLSSSNVSMKELMALVHAAYVGDLKNMKSAGRIGLDAFVLGKLKGSSFPSFLGNLTVSDGGFKYDKLLVGIDDINIVAKVSSPGGELDKALLEVDNFSFAIEENPFAVNAKVTNAISDPIFNVGANGHLDLSKLKKALPLNGINLDGTIVADFKGSGRYSYIEQKNYNAIKAQGFLELYGVDFQMEGLPRVNVKSSRFDFTQAYAQLSNTHLLASNSDITLQGKVENYLGYILDGQNLSGSLKLTSQNIDLDSLLSSFSSNEDKTSSSQKTKSKSETSQPDSSSMLLEVPTNVDANLDLDIKELSFLSIPMKDVVGKMSLKDGRANIDNLVMDVFDGRINAKGVYGVKDKSQEANVKGKINLENVQLRSLFDDVKFLEKIVPLVKGLDGNIDADVNLDTALDSNFSPKLNTMSATGKITASGVDYSKIKILNLIDKVSSKDLFSGKSAHATTLDFEIQNGKIKTKPFTLPLANSSILFEGTSSLSQEVNYDCDISIKDDYLLPISITGSFKDPNVSINQEKLVDYTTKMAKKKTSEAVASKISEKYGVDLEDAKAQKAALVEAAKKAGDKLVSEAKATAQKTINSAGSNPIKAALAKATAKSMISVAEKEAARLVERAEKEGSALIDKVNAKYGVTEKE